MNNKTTNEISFNQKNSKINIRLFAKKIVPVKIYDVIRKIRFKIVNTNLMSFDLKKMEKSITTLNDRKINANITMYSHMIEKGLSHESIRYEFGERPIRLLIESLELFKEKDLKINENFNYGMSVLKAYIDLHKNVGISVPWVQELMTEELKNDFIATTDTIGGYFLMDKASKEDNKKKSFKDLFLNRYSVREFEDEDVDISVINKAIEIATKSPSACNRQTSQVYVITNKEKIIKLLNIQSGFRGYKTPNVLLITTVDYSAYSNINDRNLGYIDGGLFTMSLTMSLEYYSLGACLLNTAFDKNREIIFKKELNISESEELITCIAVGNLKEHTKVAKSNRYNYKNKINYID